MLGTFSRRDDRMMVRQFRIIKNTLCRFYTILKRLEISNMLTVNTMEYDGRLRKYYRITKEGLKRISDFKNEWAQVMSIYRFITKEDEADD